MSANTKCTCCGVTLNEYGDVTAASPGYMVVEDERRTRAAPHRHTIVVGWGKQRSYPSGGTNWKPKKSYVVPESWWQERQAKENRPKTALTPKQEAAVERRRKERAQRESQMAAAREKSFKERWRATVANVLERSPHIEFGVGDALSRLWTRFQDQTGVVRAYLRGEFDGDDYALALCVLGAAHRHENTNYEDLLHTGIDREDARFFMQSLKNGTANSGEVESGDCHVEHEDEQTRSVTR